MPQSNDIVTFDFFPIWDLSIVTPTISIQNNSAGVNLAGCTFWFEISSGGGPIFHEGTESTPDVSGLWTLLNITEPIPQVLNHVEWSGSLFKVVGYVKDSAGIIIKTEKTIRICRPFGNTGSQANNFGVGNLFVETKCERARLYVEDKTDYTYNGNTGVLVSKFLKLIYPPDLTGTAPAPKTYNNTNSALFPISRSSDGYIVVMDAIYLYTFADGSQLKLKYKFQKTFKIQCGVDLCPLICDVQRLTEEYKKHGCSSEEREKLILINTLLIQALMAKMQPLCGIDVAKLVDEIKELGGFTCNCDGDEFFGINTLFPDTPTLDCNDVVNCVTSIFHQADPGCEISPTQWQGSSLLTMVQYILDHLPTNCGNCSAPQDLVFDITTKKLRWRSTNTSYQWLVEFNTFGTLQYAIINTPLPVYIGNNIWEIDLSAVTFTQNLIYNFRVAAVCGNNTLSNATVSQDYIPNGCTPASFDAATQFPNAVVGQAYVVNRPLTGSAPFSFTGQIIKPTWMNIAIVGSVLQFTGTPSMGDIQTNVQITLVVSNGCGLTALNAGFNVTENCVPITFNSPTFAVAQNNQPYSLNVALNGTGPFYLSGVVSPQWMNFNIVGNTLQITGTPGDSDVANDLPIRFSISNNCGKQNAADATINVNGAPCVAVSFITPLVLPDPFVNVNYATNVNLSGTAPFNLTGITKPTWMTISVVGSTIQLTGTPTQAATDVTVAFTINNACGTQSFTDSIDVLNA